MSNKETILIYGAGGLGVEVLDLCHRTGQFSERNILFVDDVRYGENVLGIPIVSFDYAASHFPSSDMILASGEPAGRRNMYARAKSVGFSLPTVIDASATVSQYCEIGEASIICAGCTIAARSKIGTNVLINVDSIVGHDVTVENSAVLASKVNTGGWCRIASGAMVGMGALIRPRINIGENSLITIGASVFADVPADVTVVGNPARISRRR